MGPVPMRHPHEAKGEFCADKFVWIRKSTYFCCISLWQDNLDSVVRRKSIM